MKLHSVFVLVAVLVLTSGTINRVSAKEKSRVEERKDVVKVEDVFANKDVLNGTKITVKGEVVKFNSAIMGKNWVHIRDGSGKPGTNDLTATTNDNAAVGDKVIVTGTLIVDKDFGAGYKYAVILEEATITPQ
jgi:hypothetical protein